MNKINVKILIAIWFVSSSIFSQNCISYHKEEMNVINHNLLKMIDYSKLKTFNKSILYFNSKMINKIPEDLSREFIGQNELLDKLLNSKLDSTQINEKEIKSFPKLEIKFEDNKYNLDQYENENVIGTLTVSRISFNKSFSLGYFYYEIYCGEDCGWSELVKVEKKNEKWIITQSLSYVTY